MSNFSIIITAGGIGKRMGGDLPKQFIEIAGKPILIQTLELFYSVDPNAQFILTLPTEWKEYWQEILLKHHCSIPHSIIDGGTERYHSIKNALKICTGDYIAVHDGVRPLVSIETISCCFTEVEKLGQVIPVIQLNESIRQVFDDTSRTVNRKEFCIVQTPQCFKKSVLDKAYSIPFHDRITDDASLVEEAGFVIHLVEGNSENIKITSKFDLLIAERFFELKNLI
jgi:2-C-methyl-D-erythritol 4-phosphate cytidylyltransferase